MRHLISLFILMTVTSAAMAKMDYWVWVDKNGVTNYAEHRPEGVTNARHITPKETFGERMGPAPDDAGPQPDNNPRAVKTNAGGIDPDAAAADQKRAIRKEIAAIKRKNCQIGKENLAKLESYSHIKVKGSDGKVRQLTEEEHQQRIKQARETIRQNCTI